MSSPAPSTDKRADDSPQQDGGSTVPLPTQLHDSSLLSPRSNAIDHQHSVLSSETLQVPPHARLPPDLPPPPRRPTGLSDVLMDDALRSLPPKAQRDAQRQRAPATVLSMLNMYTWANNPAQSQAGPSSTPLHRTTTAASLRSRSSAASISQSSTKAKPSGFRAALNRVANLASPISSKPEPSSSPRFNLRSPSTYHNSSLEATKEARRLARKKAKEYDRRFRRARTRDGDEAADDEREIELVPIEDASVRSSPRPRAAQLGDEIVELPAEPPLDVPEPSGPTVSALAQASKAGRKPKRKLQFAPERRRVRKVDLPPDYEVQDTYRNLDDYVTASRDRRRRERRASRSRKGRGRRRRGSKASRGSRSSRGSAASSANTSDSSSSSSSSDSDDSSSSSSSSSGSGHGLTIARLRAFFGDSSSSSSSDSDDSDDSSTSSSSSSSSSSISSNSDAIRSRRSSLRRASFSGKKSKSKPSAPTRSRADQSEASDVPLSPVLSRKGPLTPYFGPLTDFPLGKKATEKRQAKKARQAARRAKKREAELIKQGRLPPKPSRSARAKAIRARELAGGVTEYQLFTPMSLPMHLSCTKISTLEPTPKPAPGTSTVYKKTMRTHSWHDVRNHFYVLRNHLRQADAHGGDVGLATEAVYSSKQHRHHHHRHHHRRKASVPAAQDVRAQPSSAASPSQLATDLKGLGQDEEELDYYDGDLALPPPAIEIPDQEAEVHEPLSQQARASEKSRSEEEHTDGVHFEHQLPADQEEETRTGRHLSDMPLSPDYSTAFGKDFGRTPHAFSTLPSRPIQALSQGRPTTQSPQGTHHTSTPPSAMTQSSSGAGKHFSPLHASSEGDQSGTATMASKEMVDEGAWWLHVQCPTYRDMQEISKLFPMHPLTVEDVLQQDPREKVDVFDRLGYYFVVIRAIDERYFRYTSTSTKSPSGSPSVGPSDTSTQTADATVTGKNLDKTESASTPEPGQVNRSGEEVFEMKERHNAMGERRRSDHAKQDHGDHGHNTRLAAPARAGKGRVEIVEGIGGKEGLEGVSVGANNLYLLVFSHGVISFSFEDVKKHIDRVLTRLLEITQPVELTADWIAHDLYDTVVDAFFPLLSFVQSEVAEVEEITSGPIKGTFNRKKSHNFAPKQRRQRALLGSNPEGRLISVEPVSNMSSPSSEMEKRMPMLEVRRLKTVRAVRLLPFIKGSGGIFDRLPQVLVKQKQTVTIARLPEWEFKDALETEMRRTAAEIDEASNSVFDTQAAAEQSMMLHRLADTRKIVTGLSRLLAPKNDAVKGLRKRLADIQQLQRREEAAVGKIGANSRSMMSRTEVSMYISDVHDHIISMLNHLGPAESRLMEIHHAYLAQITLANRRFRQGADNAILFLAGIGITVVMAVFTTSLFSFNVLTPRNQHDNYNPNHSWFFGIVGCLCIFPIFVYWFVQRAWRSSKERLAKRRAAR